MVIILNLALSQLLPAIMGVACLMLWWKNSHWAAIVGYGYLLGIFITTLILRLFDGLGLQLHYLVTLGMLAGLSGLLLWPTIRKKAFAEKNNGSACKPYMGSYETKINFQKLLFWGLLSVLAVRYAGILMEIIWRPLYPWDAWMNWAPKARVWFELKELVPFVNSNDWLEANTREFTYTLGNPTSSIYPPTVPLIQSWAALSMGQWLDNLVNIPWFLCTLSLGFAFYGQSRNIGAPSHISMLITYLLLSMPFVNIHTALAGYADIWMAAYYGLAAMSFVCWAEFRDTAQGVMFILFAAICTQIKLPGMIWAATLVPAALIVMAPQQWRRLIYIALAICVAGYLYSDGFGISIPFIGELLVQPDRIAVPGLGDFSIQYHPVWSAFIYNYFLWSNWHLFWYLFAVLFLIYLVKERWTCFEEGATILTILVLLFIYMIFFYTDHYREAVDNTTINRATLHALPLFMYFIVFIYVRMFSRENKTAIRKTELQ